MFSNVGYIPKPGSISTDGLAKSVDMGALFRMPKHELIGEANSLEEYFSQQIPNELPQQISQQLADFKQRIGF